MGSATVLGPDRSSAQSVELTEFMRDRDQAKRQMLVDKLLNDEQYTEEFCESLVDHLEQYPDRSQSQWWYWHKLTD